MEKISDGRNVSALCDISMRVIEPSDIWFNVEDVFSFGLQCATAPSSHFTLKKYKFKKKKKGFHFCDFQLFFATHLISCSWQLVKFQSITVGFVGNKLQYVLQYEGNVCPKLLPVNNSVSLSLCSGSSCECRARRQWIRSSSAFMQAIFIAHEFASLAPNRSRSSVIRNDFCRTASISTELPVLSSFPKSLLKLLA